MKYIITININKGDKVRQILDTNLGIAYLRTATLSQNSINGPISIDPNTPHLVEMSYFAEHDTIIKLQAKGSIMDLNNNPYAPILEEV